MQTISSFGVTELKKVEESVSEKSNNKYQDSFLKELLKDPYYKKRVYEDLHPEDVGKYQEKDFQNIELTNIFTVDMYNDVCFLVENRMIVLIEHQSTINPNMPLRILLYLAEEYKRILQNNNCWKRMFSTKLVAMPKPEFYVVYTGKNEVSTTTLSLSDAFGGGECNLSLTVPILTNSNSYGVLREFTGLISDVRGLLGEGVPVGEALANVVTKYKSEYYALSKFLRERSDIMDWLTREYTREEIEAIKAEGEQMAFEETCEEKRAEGRAEGITGTLLKMIANKRKVHISDDAILEELISVYEVPLDEAKELMSQA